MRYWVIKEDIFYEMRNFKKGEEFKIKDRDVIDHNGELLCSIYSKYARHLGKIIEK